jgi:Mg-chelatase subunit ChlD
MSSSAAASSSDDNSSASGDYSLSLRTRAEIPIVAANDERTVKVLASVRAPVYEAEKRAPVDLVIVVDRSGSMQGNPIALVKQTLGFIVTQLSPRDRLAVVSYGTDVVVELPLERMDEAGKAKANRKIKQIQISGCTNLSGGLVRAVEVLRDRDSSDWNDVSSILLLTDGQPNEGYTSVPDILRACKDPEFAAKGEDLCGREGRAEIRKRKQIAKARMDAGLPELKPEEGDEKPENTLSLPGTINTFGFSAQHDSKFMQAIGEAGGGMFYYIENADSIGTAFSDCLGGLLSTTSQKLKLSITAANGATIKKVHTRFDLEELTPGASYVVSVTDMQSEETREVLFLVEVPEVPDAMDDHAVVELRLEYFNAIAKASEAISCAASIRRTDGDAPDDDEIADLTVDRSYNREAAADAMDAATKAGDAGHIDRARSILTDAIGAIQASRSREDPFCVALVQDMESIVKKLVSRQAYHDSVQHTLYSNVSSHGQQRTTVTSGMQAQDTYTTTSRTVQSENKDAYFSGPGTI